MKKIAIIGAGSAGLCAARHAIAANIKPVIYEQRSSVGGTWVHEPINKNIEEEVFSSMYDNLRTNQPRQVMEFPDYSYPDHLPSFIHHTEVRRYLEGYAKHFGLLKYVNFNTKVKRVKPVLCQTDSRFVNWAVESNNEVKEVTDQYNAVIVCTGHYSVPAYPVIKGFRNFKGELLHSHYYRQPEDFKGKVTLILGSGPSGTDIMLELSKTCKRVFYSHRGNRCGSTLPSNVTEVTNIKRIETNGTFVFEDGTKAAFDAFIPCTGYIYDFPFLDSSSGLRISDRIVENLYKHVFNVRYPSMAIVGIPWTIATFPVFNQQCAFVFSVLSGKKKLPSGIEMKRDTENERLKRLARDEPEHYFHKFDKYQFPYMDELAHFSDHPKNPKTLEKYFNFTMEQREKNLQNFKNINLKEIFPELSRKKVEK